MLVQICCSVDSHYFLKRLMADFPDEKIVGYFYDPNIHPYSEFQLRYQDAVRSCTKIGVEVHLGEYEIDRWFEFIKGLENEPEKGERCQACFDFRMEKSAKFAKEIGENSITTTLLMSPKKSHQQLVLSLKKICAQFGLNFIAPDYRKGGGTSEQFALAKKDMLYHQNYCGCIYALRQQNRVNLDFELLSDVGGRALINSSDDRINLYRKVAEFEENGTKFELIKDKFINYRLLRGLVKFDGATVKSHFLFNSHFERNLVKFSILEKSDELNLDKEQIKIVSFNKFNELSPTKFANIDELIKKPLSVEYELNLREQICPKNSFSPIIVVDKIYPTKAVVEVFSKLYLDVREILVRI